MGLAHKKLEIERKNFEQMPLECHPKNLKSPPLPPANKLIALIKSMIWTKCQRNWTQKHMLFN